MRFLHNVVKTGGRWMYRGNPSTLYANKAKGFACIYGPPPLKGRTRQRGQRPDKHCEAGGLCEVGNGVVFSRKLFYRCLWQR